MSGIRAYGFRRGTLNITVTLLNSTSRQGKGKVFPVHTMMAYRGNRGIFPPILNLGINGGEWLT